MNTLVPSVRSAIADNVTASRAIAREVQALRGPERDAARRRKRSLGAHTRVLLLALAFLREVAYRRVERRTNSVPDAHAIASAAGAPPGASRLPEVRAWLAVPAADAPPVAEAQPEAAEVAA